MPPARPHPRRQARRQMPKQRNILEPDAVGTLILLVAILVAWLVGGGDGGHQEGPTATLRLQAIVVGLGLAASAMLDFQRGLRNLVRVDLVCLGALYFLTYVEFLFPQPAFDEQAGLYNVLGSSRMILLGMGSLAVFRHLGSGTPTHAGADRPLGPAKGLSIQHWLGILWLSAALGYAHMLIAVNFNPSAMVDAMMAPRFNQPWGRGQLGGWKELLNELALFFYLIPPIYGILLAKRKQLSGLAFAGATAIALFTLFQGFSSGTRNIFAAYVAGMIGAYLLVLPRLDLTRLAVAALLGGTLLYLSANHMLAFRQIGLSNYLEHGPPISAYEGEEAAFFVDANVLNLALVMEAIPSKVGHTGLDIPFNALIRPVPRAIWPGKPEGLIVSIEEAAGMEGLTLAVTFVGEAFMAGGALGVILGGAFFGTLCGLWNRWFRGHWSPFSQLVYASGFFPAAISMRSLMQFTTAVLPIIGLLVLSYFLSESMGAGGRKRRSTSKAIHQPRPVSPGTDDGPDASATTDHP